MGEASSKTRGWSWEENKKFELALATTAIDHEKDPAERWKEIASALGGERSAEEVEEHYNALLADLDAIESGRFDQEL